jgi:hypothetical protein
LRGHWKRSFRKERLEVRPKVRLEARPEVEQRVRLEVEQKGEQKAKLN